MEHHIKLYDTYCVRGILGREYEEEYYGYYTYEVLNALKL